MFKEQKAKMRNLQNMVVDMSLSEAKQRNGGVSNLNKPVVDSSINAKKTSEMVSAKAIDNLPLISFDSNSNSSRQERILNTQTSRPIPNEQQQMDELRKVQEEVSKLLTNPFNIVMATNTTTTEKPTSKITIEDITNMEDNTTREIQQISQEVSDQRRRFENMLSSYNIQKSEQPKIQEVFYEDDGGDDDDFLKDMELYNKYENAMKEDMENLQNDLQLVSS
jgi:septal ring factor EnvC (AmiA/AmiB activator)